ncbi:NepR family anti-sigma factor [Aestuariivirga litoralis]|uniref:NepR family anti-sigma factor n=1 Tax=Aestuariivirga litoralis TaxID=2650924 RepID=UPI00248684C2|nr:NepR family anti-sigma factor [Aestuariivirga litoralis]MBG1232418.1 hypothetical protein [Aestuariivirga litoralis]
MSDKKRQSEMDDESDVSSSVADAVSGKLKAYYNSVTGQPIPDRFMDLLAKLDAASASKPGKTND